MSGRSVDGQSLRFKSIDTSIFPHGTVARYVAKCRCSLCRKALSDRARERMQRAREAAAEVKPNGPPASRVLLRAGREFHVLMCPGTAGNPCIRGGAWLRSGLCRKIGVCMACIERATVWNGLVSARAAQKHLLRMRRKGIGYKTIADAAGVSRSLCQELVTGKVKQVRVQTERRILATDEGARTEGCRVPAETTKRLIGQILARGFTQTWVSRQLGCQVYVFSKRAWAHRKTVKTVTAVKVEKLWRRVKAHELKPRPRWVDSAPTWSLIRELLADGFTMYELGELLHYPLQAKTLQLALIRPETAEKVAALHAQIAADAGGERPVYDDKLSIDDFAQARTA